MSTVQNQQAQPLALSPNQGGQHDTSSDSSPDGLKSSSVPCGPPAASSALAVRSPLHVAGRTYALAKPETDDDFTRWTANNVASLAALRQPTTSRKVEETNFWGTVTAIRTVTDLVPWSKELLFAEHFRLKQELAAERKKLQEFLEQVSRAAGVSDPVPFPPPMAEKPTDFGLAEQPVDVVQKQLNESLESDQKNLALAFSMALHQRATGPRPTIGVLTFSKLDRKVCHFYFRRYGTFETQKMDERSRWLIDRTPFEEVHQHDLVNADLHDVMAVDGWVPDFLKTLVNAVPQRFRPITKLLKGRQIRDLVLRRQRSEDEWQSGEPRSVVRSDVALVIHPYVLAGCPADQK